LDLFSMRSKKDPFTLLRMKSIFQRIIHDRKITNRETPMSDNISP
jgi:hypothetical protein